MEHLTEHNSGHRPAENTGPQSSNLQAKLDAHRAMRTGDETFTLPETKVVVSYPKFRPYHFWQKAQRLGGKNADRIQLYYIIALCTFDGERMLANDYAEKIPADDHMEIVGRIFGGEEEPAEGGEGKGP